MRGDILAATDDDVLDTAGQVQIAVCVKQSLVAGTKPSIHKSASVGFEIVVVSAKYIGALNRDLAPLAGAQVIAILIHDSDAQPGAYSDRTGFAMAWGQRIGGHLMSCADSGALQERMKRSDAASTGLWRARASRS